MRTGDQAYIKDLNKSIALKVLRTQTTVSRTQISKQTGLNKATVSSIIDELIEIGLATEIGRGHSSVGRRPVLLHFNAQAGHAVGIEVSVGYIRGVLVNLAGEPIKVIHEFVHSQHDIRIALEQIRTLAQNLIAAAPSSTLGILGIGIGVPGLVNFPKGIVLDAPNLGWDNIPLRSLLEAMWPHPTYVDNEANTGALGEKLFGGGKNVSNMVYVSAGSGLGAGMIVANGLLRGADGLAGEFGHITLETQGPKCSCGRRGCLEIYASEKSLVERYRQLTHNADNEDIETILAKLREGDQAAIEAVHTVGYYLGIGVSGMINALNPSLVVIGNRLAQIGPYLLDAVSAAVLERCFIKPHSAVTIQLSELGMNACAIGAASLVLDHYFAGPHVQD